MHPSSPPPYVVELLEAGGGMELTDAAEITLGLWRSAQADWPRALLRASNARRLLAMPELAPDVGICLRRDVLEVVPCLVGGVLR